MNTKAVVEKITNDTMVILVGESEHEFVLHKDEIPQFEEYNVGDWLDVSVNGEVVEIIRVNKEETESVKKRIKEKMERLRKQMGPKDQ